MERKSTVLLLIPAISGYRDVVPAAGVPDSQTTRVIIIIIIEVYKFYLCTERGKDHRVPQQQQQQQVEGAQGRAFAHRK